MKELQDALISFLVLMITGCGTVISAFVIAWLKAKLEELKAKMTVDQQEAFDKIITMAVNAAEQSGLTGEIESKKDLAIGIATYALAQQGLKIDLKSIADAIEAAVWTELNESDPTKNGALRENIIAIGRANVQ